MKPINHIHEFHALSDDGLHAKASGAGNFPVEASSPSRSAGRDVDYAALFTSHRPRLLATARRMLGNHADAEDVVQDAYLRWHDAMGQDILSPLGFLITVTTRLCLDRLRSARKEEHTGTERLEPVIEDHAPSPAEQCEVAREVSVAFLAVLERLRAEERAVFLLREVFDYNYSEVAGMVGKSEAACRQLLRRALPRVREARPRFVVVAEARERAFNKFLAAMGTDDREAILALLAGDVRAQAS